MLLSYVVLERNTSINVFESLRDNQYALSEIGASVASKELIFDIDIIKSFFDKAKSYLLDCVSHLESIIQHGADDGSDQKLQQNLDAFQRDLFKAHHNLDILALESTSSRLTSIPQDLVESLDDDMHRLADFYNENISSNHVSFQRLNEKQVSLIDSNQYNLGFNSRALVLGALRYFVRNKNETIDSVTEAFFRPLMEVFSPLLMQLEKTIEPEVNRIFLEYKSYEQSPERDLKSFPVINGFYKSLVDRLGPAADYFPVEHIPNIISNPNLYSQHIQELINMMSINPDLRVSDIAKPIITLFMLNRQYSNEQAKLKEFDEVFHFAEDYTLDIDLEPKESMPTLLGMCLKDIDLNHMITRLANETDTSRTQLKSELFNSFSSLLDQVGISRDEIFALDDKENTDGLEQVLEKVKDFVYSTKPDNVYETASLVYILAGAFAPSTAPDIPIFKFALEKGKSKLPPQVLLQSMTANLHNPTSNEASES